MELRKEKGEGNVLGRKKRGRGRGEVWCAPKKESGLKLFFNFIFN